MSLNIQGDDFNAPTNPQLTSSSSDFSDGDRIYTAIVKHGGVSVSITGFGGTVTENSNLANTKGFRVKCYDSLTTTGVRFNPTDWDSATQTFTTNDYFVLLYSDSPFQHHFAKITEVKTEDLIGDAFEFEPKLGNEIPKDTKFIIFQVTQNTDIVALSLGMLQDDDAELEDELARRMSVARPLFYFYDGLDKERELDHNTKYYAMRECGTANTYTLDNTDPSRAFVTIQDFGKTVIDYSKFSHRVKLTDKLRDLDAIINTDTNEGIGYTQNTTDYDLCYKNARRIADDEINSAVYTGPIRYLHYDFSPTKSNVLYNVYDHANTESIDGKGGFSETSVLDNARIIPRKIKEFYAYRARHNIHRGDFNAFFPLKTTYDSSTSSTVFSFETEYDLGTVLNAGDEVKLGDEILVVNSFGTLSGTTQTITFQNSGGGSPLPYARTELEGAFTAQSITPTSGDILYRRAYNATDKTLLLDTHLLNGRFSKMYVSFISHNHIDRFATVTACDSTKGMITLAFDDDSYNSNPLSFTKGQYQLFIERFNGEIESIESKKENGQSIVEIKGRDKFNKLLSPIVNLNTLFSEDIIYSSNSPYNKLEELNSGDTHTIALGDTQIDLDVLISNTSVLEGRVFAGVRLFGPNGYVGEITNLSFHTFNTKRTLIITPAITELNSEALYIDTEKNYVLSKSLSSSHLATNKPTSLTGAANKGLIFTAGNKIKSIRKSATTTSSNTTVTVADTSDLLVGMEVKEHPFIPSGATIVSIDSDTTFTISSAATFNFPAEAVFFGGEGDSLVATSANTNEGAIGYAINSPSSISNDFSFQTLLKDEHGSAGASSFDTVNTLIDFEVVSTTKKNNVTEIELAPYVPITLGRKTHFYEDVSEMSFTSVGTIAQSIGNVDNLYFKMSTSNTHSLNKGDPLFFVPNETPNADKVFIGHVFNIRHTATTTNSNETYIQLDRSPEDLDTGDFIFLGTKPTNELALINGAHLWGGKILIAPHPKLNSNNNIVPLNVESTTISGDYFSRFGQPYYKITGISNGTFGLNLPLVKNGSKTIRTPYPFKGKFSYLANSYNFKPNISSSNIINAHTTSSSYRVLPLEERGLTSAFGSNFSDTRIHPTANRSILKLGFTEQRTKAALTFDSESSARLFIYVNGDILPYSSLRKDSLMCDSNKDINNYNLFLMENKKQKDSLFGGGDRLLLKDNNFQTVTFNTSQDISQLNRFGIMRLTEVCFDFFYNTINPEKPIPKARNNDNYGIETLLGTSTSVGTISSIVDDVIEFTGSVSVSTNDFLYDDKGRLIGQLQSGTPISGNQYRLKADGFLTNNGSAATNCIKISHTTVVKKGRNKKDTFARVDSVSLHPLKCCIIPKDSLYGSNSGDDAYSANNNAALSFSGTGGGNRDSEIVGPVAFDSNILGNANYNVGQFAVLQQMTAHTNNQSATSMISNRGHNSIIGVVLDRFGIEDGAKHRAIEGNTSQLLLGDTLNTLTINSADFHATVGSLYSFKGFDNVNASSRSYGGSRPYEADGVIMCFKPRLWIDSDASTGNYSVSDITSSAGTLKKVVIKTTRPTASGQITFFNTFLKFIDLTGCYLVPESGVNAQGTSITGQGFETRAGMNNSIPQNGTNNNELIYVISHEVSNSDSEEHHLICTAELEDQTGYRILQPNETCFYEFMPKSIKFNFLSSEYTKKAYKNEVYDEIKDSYFHKDGKLLNNSIYSDEGILSMFVIVDTDKQSTEDSLVLTSTENFFSTKLPDGNYIMNFSDGEESEKISFTSKSNAKHESIELGKGINRQGIVSVSETFTVTSNDTLQINPSRACIGTTVSIGLEGEDLINELLETEGTQFQTTGTDTPMYLAPNYQGVDLYSAINYILDRKDMKIVEENDVFKIVPEDENEYYTNITIDDSGDYLISEFEKQTTLFDFYNEIIVYGSSHKATRKDIRSINKRGRKTLEVVDGTLLTQEEVDKRATKLLRIHSRFNQRLSFTMQNKGINQLRVGDIVTVSLPRENIETGQFIVLEMEHQLVGFIKLQLGRYTKDLSDIFSELLIASKETKSALRSADLVANEISFNFLDTLNTKELKLLVRKREASGGMTLGFGTTLGFTSALGFNGGTVTITNLLEEDLA
tara:strand:+ start:5089 stop:11445 length:6357 start_codon:yes stop_codon:yes gene_type:complete